MSLHLFRRRPRYSSQNSWFWHRVLIGIDSGEQSLLALKWYLDNIHKPQYHLVIVYVSQPLHFNAVSAPCVPPEAIKNYYLDLERTVKEIKTAVEAIFDGQNVSHEIIEERGQIAKTLCLVAKEKKTDMIVLGTRGMGSVRRVLNSSVGDYVMHHAHCPVLICKE